MGQIFSYGNALNVAGFNDAVKTNILKSKMAGKYAPVPAQHNAQNIDTIARFRAWLRHKYQTEMVGSQQASLQRLTQEKFLNSDTPETYEYRIRPLLLGVANDDANSMTFILNHLPDELFTRMKIANPAGINEFFIELKNMWLERRPSTFTSHGNVQTHAMPVIQPTQNMPLPEPIIQPAMPLPQPTYYKVDPKAYIENTYGPGTWALDNQNRDNINKLLSENQRNMESLIDQIIQRRIQLESNPKFEKINQYRNIRDTAQKAITL